VDTSTIRNVTHVVDPESDAALVGDLPLHQRSIGK
jgi:hypothetical protein